MKADRHQIVSHGLPADTARWLHKYGYRGTALGHVGTDPACLFARPGEPPQVAWIGDTLRYDGRRKVVVVEVAA